MNAATAIIKPASKKRLGQFFSGALVGRLLASLSDAQSADTIVDPMIGSGDLIRSCLDVGARPSTILGIEIDPIAARSAREIDNAEVVLGSAFDPAAYGAHLGAGFDLVIANPPYVRYQDFSSASGGQPSSDQVREGLIQCLRQIGDLDDDEREPLIAAATSYSGHADLAVPSVILCMALVARGGKMGLVLPQAWLSRNYSTEVRDCLENLFHVELIVEDASATWFEDALVRTTLLVAHRRRGHQASVAPCKRLRIHSSAANEASLVGEVSSDANTPERSFAMQLRLGEAFDDEKVEVRDCLYVAKSSETRSMDAFQGLPGTPPTLQTIEDLGVTVSQGLRTGANDFFYVTPVTSSQFRSSASLGSALIACPPEAMRSAIRDQGGRPQAVLDLRHFVLPEDADIGDTDQRTIMDIRLADHVRRAGSTLSGKPGREKPIKDLSAVKTNVRPQKVNQPARFWYMLPDFQPRHTPDCYLPRLNAKRPLAQVSDGETLVDANFVTLACNGKLDRYGLAALINSSWTWLWLENEAAVMGGGALKIEATMVGRLPIPKLNSPQISLLNNLGVLAAVQDVDPLVRIGVITAEQNDMLINAAAKRLSARTKK